MINRKGAIMKHKKILALMLCIAMTFACLLIGCKDDKGDTSNGLDVTTSEDGQWTGVHRP